jgi:hypothetical protein
MGRFFPFRRPQRGKPISTRGLAAGLAGMDEALTGMRVENGQVVWSSNNIPTIVFGDDGLGNYPNELLFRYPFGRKWNFGIRINGAVVTIFAGLVYRGGVAAAVAKTDVEITTDGDWIALKLVPGETPDEDAWSLVRWPDADGLPQDHDGALYRGLYQFGFANDRAKLRRVGWMPGEVAIMQAGTER